MREVVDLCGSSDDEAAGADAPPGERPLRGRSPGRASKTVPRHGVWAPGVHGVAFHGAPKGAAACGKSPRRTEKQTAATVFEASSMRKEQVPSWEDNMMELKDRVDPAGACAAMPTGVVASVKNLEAQGFGFIKPDSGEAASGRARARSARSLRSCARHVWFLFCTRVAPPQA